MSADDGRKNKDARGGAEQRGRGITGRMSMRDAIVVSEILSPPLALRKSRSAKRG